MRRVTLALGSNVGNRLRNFKTALKNLRDKNLQVKDTSFLYLTKTQLNKNQGDFLNAAIDIETNLSPHDLLKELKVIEKKMGRDLKSPVDKGPRVIDLDILYDEKNIIETEDLIIPHIGIPKRDFYLQPLLDLKPDFVHPKEKQTNRKLMEKLLRSRAGLSYPQKVLGFDVHETCEKYFDLEEHTVSFGIVNTSPESYIPDTNAQDSSMPFKRVLSLIENGCDVIDIGGESGWTGPVISPKEEIRRIVPLVKKIREDPRTKDAILSIDSGKSDTLRDALANGANIINDFYGGRWDSETINVAAELQAPIVLTNGLNFKGDKEDTVDDLYGEMKQYFADYIKLCKSKGIPRWDIIIDPGFSQNKPSHSKLDMIKRLKEEVISLGYPTMAAFSHKMILNHWLQRPEDQLCYAANLGLTAIMIEKGCQIVRLHEVETLQVMNMADLVYRKKTYDN